VVVHEAESLTDGKGREWFINAIVYLRARATMQAT